MDAEEVIGAAAFVVFAGAFTLMREKRNPPRWWVRSFLAKRETEGAYSNLMVDLRLQYDNFLKMNFTDFENLLNLVAPLIVKSAQRRNPVSPGEQLATTIRFLATGDSYESLMYLHRISKAAISRFVPEVCRALIKVLHAEIKIPTTKDEWLSVAKGFEKKWDYPNCIGSVDGKHIEIQAPANSGSLYFNYKSTFSIVMMALCDADYKFLFVDVGVQGRVSDGGVFLATDLYTAVEQNTIDIPESRCLPARSVEVPMVIAADDAFPLTVRILKPYPGNHNKGTKERAFNYRHSRARRVIENVFGIMSGVFRVLRKPIATQPDTAKLISLCCAYLHNYLRRHCRPTYIPQGTFDYENVEGNVIEGRWRADGVVLPGLMWCPQKDENPGVFVREEFSYFFQEQPLPWQNRYA